VLAALCMLLVMLMAMMTLGIGQRVREKIELQTMTDAAAQTDAVLTARAFNEVSLSNRGIVGDMVAMAATFSVTTYASEWASDVKAGKAAINDAKGKYRDILADCAAKKLPPTTPMCQCASDALGDGDWGAALAALDDELTRFNGLPLDPLDAAAGQQASDYRSAALSMHDHASAFIEEELSFETSPYQVAKTYARRAGAVSGEMKTPLANDSISLREVHHAIIDDLSGPEHKSFVNIGRGTRYPFVLNRGVNEPKNSRFAAALAKRNVTKIRLTANTATGSADWVANDQMLKAWENTTIFASFNGGYSPCGGASGSAGAAPSTLITDTNGHKWPGFNDSDPKRHELIKCEAAPGCVPPSTPLYDYATLGDGTEPPEVQCKLPKCERTEDIGGMPRLATAAGMAAAMAEALGCAPCPGVWPSYLGYQAQQCNNDKDDLYCQPKQYAIIQRDYGARTNADPWNLLFRFRFSARGDGSGLDLKRLQLADGTDISRQTAVAGGLAYYHYNGGAKWSETPNLMNPFWRGSLARMDVDAQGNPFAPTPGDDIPNFFLQAVNPSAGSSRSAATLNHDVFLELTRNGYQGGM
jgi:hypothetical protein